MNIKFVGIYLFAFLLPLPIPMKYTGMGLIVMICNLLVLTQRNDITKLKTVIKNYLVILFFLYFLTDFLHAVVSFDFTETYYREVKLMFAIFPLIALLNSRVLFQQYENILRFFFFGVVGYISISWIYIIYYYTIKHPSYVFDFTDHYVVYVLAQEFPWAMHHTYIGLYILCITTIIFYATIISNKIKPIIGWGLSILLLVNTFYIGGKSTTMLLILFMIGILFKSRLKKKITKHYKYYVLGFVLAVVAGIMAIYEWLTISVSQSLTLRGKIYDRCIEVIAEALPTGIGKSGLNKIPLDIQQPEGKNLIPHNVHFNELIMNGVVGELILLSMLTYLLIVAYKHSTVFFIFVLSIVITGFMEDLLTRQRGILFFVFFSVIFYIKFVSYNNQKNTALNK